MLAEKQLCSMHIYAGSGEAKTHTTAAEIRAIARQLYIDINRIQLDKVVCNMCNHTAAVD